MSEAIREFRRTGDIQAISALVPYAAFVGLEVIRQGDGVVTVLRHKDSNIGNTTLPAIHGGVIGGMLEHAAAIHLIWECDLDALPKIINISVDYLRPARPLDTFARGVMVKQGRKVANMRVEAWQTDPSKPVAAAHVHFLMD